MSQNKNINNTLETIAERIAIAGQNAGLVMMTAATSLGLVEFAHHDSSKHTVVNAQPAYSFANAAEDTSENRKQRFEETHPHGSSSSVNQRTPGRTGKV